MNKERKNMYISIIALIIGIIGVTIGYAALSATLNVNFGNVTQNAITWDVGFIGTTVEGASDGTSDTGRSCGTASITPSTVTLGATSLSKPGDKCTYPLTIKNNGGITAELTSIIPKIPTSISCDETSSSMICGNITYKLTSDAAGETPLSVNSTLDIDKEITAYLVVAYTGNTLNTADITQSNGGFTITYSQK